MNNLEKIVLLSWYADENIDFVLKNNQKKYTQEERAAVDDDKVHKKGQGSISQDDFYNLDNTLPRYLQTKKIHGKYKGKVIFTEDELIINNMVIKVFEQYIGNIRHMYKNIEIATFTFDVQSCNIFHLHHSNCRKRLRNDS